MDARPSPCPEGHLLAPLGAGPAPATRSGSSPLAGRVARAPWQIDRNATPPTTSPPAEAGNEGAPREIGHATGGPLSRVGDRASRKTLVASPAGGRSRRTTAVSPKLGSRSEDQTRLAMTAALKRRPRKNRDVALSDTTPHADDSMHPKDTPHRRGPTSTSEGGFGLRSQHPTCPARTPGRVREPGKRCVRFDASALPLTRIIRFSFGGNSDLQVKVRFLCINFRDAHNTSTRYPQSRAHCRTAKPNRRGFPPSGMDARPRPTRCLRSRDTSGHYDRLIMAAGKRERAPPLMRTSRLRAD